MKIKSFARLKKEADKWCSEWIRLKDADWKGFNTCYTCGIRKHYKELQAGHYVSRTYLNLRYYEPNLRPQCVTCNIFRKGNMDEYALRLEKETPGILEHLNNWKHRKSTPLKAKDLELIIKEFKEKIKNLTSNTLK